MDVGGSVGRTDRGDCVAVDGCELRSSPVGDGCISTDPGIPDPASPAKAHFVSFSPLNVARWADEPGSD